MNTIFLDNNSTTTIDADVLKQMVECYQQGFVNPASQHQLGQKARRVLETTRRNIGSLLGAQMSGMEADRVVFTSGGTEANNLALLGLAGEPPGNVVLSSIEHPSIQQAAAQLSKRGFEIRILPVTLDGICDLTRFEPLIDSETKLVTLMLGNNETGVVQPVGEIAQLCHPFDIPIHTDAVQAIGKIPVGFEALNVTSMSFTAHKLHGPRGVGGLIIKSGAELQPLLFGGFQQMGLRPGTESIALATGMERAISLYCQQPEEISDYLRSLRQRFENSLSNTVQPITINGLAVNRLPHTTNVSFLGLDRQELLMALDMAGICCSTGSSCSSGSSEPSPVLAAMGCGQEVISSAIRFGFSRLTTTADIDLACQRISKVVKTLRAKKTN